MSLYDPLKGPPIETSSYCKDKGLITERQSRCYICSTVLTVFIHIRDGFHPILLTTKLCNLKFLAAIGQYI